MSDRLYGLQLSLPLDVAFCPLSDSNRTTLELHHYLIIRPRRSHSASAYSRQTFPWTICRSVCRSVCLSSALWKNGESDPDAVWHSRSNGSRNEAGGGVCRSVHGKGYFWGGRIWGAPFSKGAYRAYVCYSAATRPSSQITLGRLVRYSNLTLSWILSGTRPSVKTVSGVCLKRICSLDTSAFSALEVPGDNCALQIYLLTYLLRATMLWMWYWPDGIAIILSAVNWEHRED